MEKGIWLKLVNYETISVFLILFGSFMLNKNGIVFLCICLWWAEPSLATSPVKEIDCEHHHCAAVVDAGSSGSRIHVLTYNLDESKHPIDIQDVYSKKIKPGLSAVALDQVVINQYLSDLTRDCDQKMPIYVYATAGMRLLPLESQEQYYAAIKQWFAAHPQWTLVEARTISGKEEGIYGWLSLNYYLDTLQDERLPLVSLVEIGGASAQIVTPIDDTSGIQDDNWHEVIIYGRHITLFSHSFLGLGANEVLTQSMHLPMCFPDGYSLKEGAGAGDANQCQIKLEHLVADYHVTDISLSALQQRQVSKWYTVGAVSGLASKTPFLFSDQSFTSADLLDQANTQYCHQSYSDLVKRDVTDQYVHSNCLLASYFYSLSTSGLGLNLDETIHFLPNYDGSWTVGVLLAKF